MVSVKLLCFQAHAACLYISYVNQFTQTNENK